MQAARTVPLLEAPRLRLRAITDDDAVALFHVYSNPEWLRWWGQPPHKSVLDTRAAIATLQADIATGRQLRWAIVLGGTDVPVGTAGYYRFIPHHYRAEVTLRAGPDAAGHGYMTEALRTILSYGFHELGLHSIEAGIDPENHASIRIVEWLGFVREGYLRENNFCEGRAYDTLINSKLSGRPPIRVG